MFFIPTWLTNIVFLVTGWLSGYQLSRVMRPNPIMNIPFLMVVFCMLMVLIVTMKNRVNPWLSMVFLLIAVVSLGVIIRQFRMLPPKKQTE